MFTGIIEARGKIIKLGKSKSNLELYIGSPLTAELHIDQSVSHDGVCLTIDQLGPDWHRCTLIHETLNITNFNDRLPGDFVNLERAMKIDSRLEGHLVQGHADASALCRNIEERDGSWVFEFELSPVFYSLVVQKGSITVNGVSLTISAVLPSAFQVSIIPYTFHHTNFQSIKIGDRVNIEFDVLGKYIHRQLEIYKLQGLR